MPSSPSAYCQPCKTIREMVALRPYDPTGKVKLHGTDGFGLTGKCSVCGKKKDFVVSESLYIELSKDRQIAND